MSVCLCILSFFFLIISRPIYPLNKLFAVPFLKPINPYIKHWEAAHFDAKIIADARHKHEIRRRKRHANSNSTINDAVAPPTNTIKFQFFAHNR